MITTEQKILAALCHIAYLAGGVPLIIAPLIIFFWKKDDYFIRNHAKQALVAQTLLMALSLSIGFLTFFLIGVLLWPLLFLVAICFFCTSLFAAYAAFTAREYQYPLIQEIVRKL